MKKHVGRFILEIAIIFIGITLSFLFEEFRDDHKSLIFKKEIVSSLLIDIEIKQTEIISDSKTAREIVSIIDTCLFLNKKGDVISKSLVDNLISSLSNDYASFSTVTPTYISLSTSSVWQQLPDTLRRQIFKLYNENYVYIQNTFSKSTEYSSYLKTRLFPINQFNFFNSVKPGAQLESRETDYVLQINNALKNQELRSMILVIRNEITKIIRTQDRSLKSQEKMRANLKKYLDAL